MSAYLQRSSKLVKSRGIGIASDGKKVFLFSPFSISVSEDGLNFKHLSKKPTILDAKGKRQSILNCQDFRISNFEYGYFLTYKARFRSIQHTSAAFSNDLTKWKQIGKISTLKETAMIVPNYKYKGQYVLYFGERDIKIATSYDLESWHVQKDPVLEARSDCFDNFPFLMGNLIPTPRGIILIYYVKVEKREGTQYLAGCSIFDKNNPSQILWRKSTPVFPSVKNWAGKSVYPLGVLNFKGKLLLYFTVDKEVFVVSYPDFDQVIFEDSRVPLLEKHKANPIIKPILDHAWESQATFNAAAVYDDGKVHLVYRAIGESNTSVLGYAVSKDGINIDERLSHPIYSPIGVFESPGGFPIIDYMSGGGYGGCEDPRITRIDDKFYLTYVAFNGSDHPKVAITSIKAEDFLNRRWAWSAAKLMSAPGVVNKNPCLLPERIKGKYVIFHRVYPDILIDLVDDLDFDDNKYLKGEFKIAPRDKFWDSRKIGAGAPPIKTTDGWLLIYHGVGNHDPSRYKVGAMLLDINDPTAVLYRSNHPILVPDQRYENEGYKAGVVYPCGAVVVDKRLIVYYGGADMVVCAATKDLDRFLLELKYSNELSLDPVYSARRILSIQ